MKDKLTGESVAVKFIERGEKVGIIFDNVFFISSLPGSTCDSYQRKLRARRGVSYNGFIPNFTISWLLKCYENNCGAGNVS
jgi:hypothetical protein